MLDLVLLRLAQGFGAGAEISGAEREAWWRRLNDVVDYEAYQRKVRRRIAVVALTPTSRES